MVWLGHSTKNFPVVFVMPQPIYYENMSEIEFSTLAELFPFLWTGTLNIEIFWGKDGKL